jgi:hypothetical protein
MASQVWETIESFWNLPKATTISIKNAQAK